MGLTSPLVHEKVWLDKPKYDAAERQYYERLSKSSVLAKDEVDRNSSDNSNVLLSESVEKTTGIVGGAREQTSVCPLKPKDAAVKPSQEINTKNVCSKPAEENVCPRSNEGKKQNKGHPKEEAKSGKQEVCKLNNESNKVCSLTAKQDKNKKESPQTGVVPEKHESEAKVINEAVSNKSIKNNQKSNSKNIQEKTSQPVQSISSRTANIIEPKSDASKPKGYFLPTKSLLTQPDPSLTKGTNVNTIPELSKLTESNKPSNVVKKKNTENRLPPLDKQESTDLIIPTNLPPDSPNPIILSNDPLNPSNDELSKKDSKKRKRNKKERHRDKKGVTQNANSWNSLAGEVAKARQHIKNSLQCIDDIAVTSNNVSIEITNRLLSLEKINQDLTNRIEKMEDRIISLEKALEVATSSSSAPKPAPSKPAPTQQDDDDDGVDLFGSDSEEEDAEAAKIKEQRLAEYAAKKSKKPALVAKSSIILDVKPWDDETDMKAMEAEVRKITADGLLWGASKLAPLAYGIHKLQINCVIEDDKISVDWLQETIQEIEDYVQSVDIAAFNKI